MQSASARQLSRLGFFGSAGTSHWPGGGSSHVDGPTRRSRPSDDRSYPGAVGVFSGVEPFPVLPEVGVAPLSPQAAATAARSPAPSAVKTGVCRCVIGREASSSIAATRSLGDPEVGLDAARSQP